MQYEIATMMIGSMALFPFFPPPCLQNGRSLPRDDAVRRCDHQDQQQMRAHRGGFDT